MINACIWLIVHYVVTWDAGVSFHKYLEYKISMAQEIPIGAKFKITSF